MTQTKNHIIETRMNEIWVSNHSSDLLLILSPGEVYAFCAALLSEGSDYLVDADELERLLEAAVEPGELGE